MIDGRDLDRQIERELNRVLGPVEQSSVPAWRAPAPVNTVRRLVGGAGTAAGAKALTGVAVVVLAGAGAGVAGAAAVTGSINPSDWRQQAAECQASLRASGMNGFAGCFTNTSARQSLGSKRHPAAQSPATHSGGQTGQPNNNRPSPSPLALPSGTPIVQGPPLISPGPGPGASH